MQDVLLDLAIPSRLEAMGTVQSRLDAALRQLGLDDDACHWIGLATHEAVVNAIVHGNRRDPGRRVEVQLACDGDDLVIRVADRGDGFDPAVITRAASEEASGGLSLVGMAERARLVGGELDVRSAPGGGTSITLRVPG